MFISSLLVAIVIALLAIIFLVMAFFIVLLVGLLLKITTGKDNNVTKWLSDLW